MSVENEDCIYSTGSEKRHLLGNSGTNENKNRHYTSNDWIPARYALSFLAFLGFVNVYCLRVNLSVAMVAMVNSTDDSNSTKSDECPDPNSGNNSTKTKHGEFDWDETTQGYVLGAFFYGYILTQIPGGWLASRYGGKPLFGFGVLCTSVLTLITPIAARTSVYLFIVVRILEGIGEGVTFPSMHAMWGQWAPMWERSRLVAFTYAGSQLGTVISLPISGVLCDSDFMGGWPSVFYIFGALGCIWFIAWMLLAHNTPADHPRISREEREYIENSIGKKEKLSTPWKAILTSPPALALCVTHFSFNWGFYMLLTCLPTYLKTILKFNVKENGFLSALPYAVMWIVQIVVGVGADYIRSHGYISTKNTRKICNAIGLVVPAILLIISSYMGCDHLTVITFLTLSVGISGVVYGGYNCNHLDIAPRFAGVLMGLTNATATIPGFLAPAIVGWMTNGNQTMDQWHKIFFISGGICLFGCIVNLIFADGEEQPWARASSTHNIIGKEEGLYQSVQTDGKDDADIEVHHNSSPPDYSQLQTADQK